MRLAHRAQRSLSELLEELGEARHADTERESIHHLFGECRFGFRAALDAWPENDVARGGLRLAIKSMAEYEIGSNNIHAARLLVAELEDAPQDLRRRLADLERSRAADAERRDQLEALGRDLDPVTGSRTRTFVAFVLGAAWTGLPIATHFFLRATHGTPNPRISMLSAGVSLLLALALGYWARESMTKSVLNRRGFALVVFVMAAQVLLGAALSVAGIDPTTAVSLNFFLWFATASIAALTLEWRIWPSAVVYAVALFSALLRPDAVLLIMGASNALLTINLVSIWRPMFAGSRKP